MMRRRSAAAYILKHQDFWVKDQVLSIADFHLPISEGSVNKSYPQVGVQLLRHALQKQPLLFGLGIGGYDEALTQLLAAAGWSMFSVPFFFRVVHPSAFLQNISYLRRSAASRYLADICAATGLGWLGIRAVQAVGCRKAPRDPALAVRAGGRVLRLGGRPLAAAQEPIRHDRRARRRNPPHPVPQGGCKIHPPEDRRSVAADRLGRAVEHAACRPQTVRQHAARIDRRLLRLYGRCNQGRRRRPGSISNRRAST